MSNVNTLVYKYGGQNAERSHFRSILENRIARSGKIGKLPKNKKIGDDIIVVSESEDKAYYTVSLGKYLGVDPNNPDIWQDDASPHDRNCVEKWQEIVTKRIPRKEFLKGAEICPGIYNDNGVNASRWRDQMILSIK